MQGIPEIVERQAGVVALAQSREVGLSRDQMRHRVRRGSWRKMYAGVYLTHPGEPDFRARVWAAVLHAGPTSMASHRTAGRLQGLLDDDPVVIDLTIAEAARGHAVSGLRLHRSTTADAKRHPARLPPQTRIEETVLDLVANARTEDEVVTWVLRSCQRRLTTPARLAAAADGRARLRHRSLLMHLVAEARAGVASALESRYRTGVELAHRLPRAERGRSWIGPDGVRRYFDARYPHWRLRVELEGLAFHPAERAHVDQARDNAAVLVGDVVLRYGWRQVVGEPCTVAAQVAAVLTLRGWPGSITACGPRCRAPSDKSRHP